MRRRPCGRKFSCRLHAQGYQHLQELRNKCQEDWRPLKNGVFILAALKYLNENSPYGLYPMLTPIEAPSPKKTIKPVLRLVARESPKEG